MKRDFQYVDAERTKKPGYLQNKWNRLYPGWNRRPKPSPEVIDFKTRRARGNA